MSPEEELAQIRRICETVMTVSPSDTAADAVQRMTLLAWPQGATTVWFKNWQAACRKLREHDLEPPPIVKPLAEPLMDKAQDEETG